MQAKAKKVDEQHRKLEQAFLKWIGKIEGILENRKRSSQGL